MKVVNNLESIKKSFSSKNKEVVLEALCIVDAEIANELFDSIVHLTSHFDAEIRVAALQALRFADQSYLVDVIRENLHDENKKVRQAASELFHLRDLAA